MFHDSRVEIKYPCFGSLNISHAPPPFKNGSLLKIDSMDASNDFKPKRNKILAILTYTPHRPPPPPLLDFGAPPEIDFFRCFR